MTANIAYYRYPSARACLLSSAAVCLSAFLPPGQLTPAQAEAEYVNRYGPIPLHGAAPNNVWQTFRDAYNVQVLYPDAPFGWDLSRVARILDRGIPLLLTYGNQWSNDGTVLSSHAVTLFDVGSPGKAAEWWTLWDQANGQTYYWPTDQLYWQSVYFNYQWHWFPKYSGWLIAILPMAWELPE